MHDSIKKIHVGILGATGSVGQKFIQLLDNHPFFEVKEIAASERSANKPYHEAVNWVLSTDIPEKIKHLKVKSLDSKFDCPLLFSGLDASIAGEAEEKFAENGHIIVSNSKNHRFDNDVPLLIPEVNPDHLGLLNNQKFNNGKIVTNPNCSTIGIVMALKPILDNFGLEQINITTMQAISGAGYPGLSSLDIVENVIPYINGEEEKIELEPKKIFGNLSGNTIEYLNVNISAQCNRVQVIDGHLVAVQVKLKKKTDIKSIISIWQSFLGEPQYLNLPSAPKKPIHYFHQNEFPQPRLHRNLENGMAVSVGGLRKCNIFDYKFNVLSHNTVRGAAGGAILCAELMKEKGYLNPWL